MPIRVCFVLLRTYAVFRPELGGNFGGAEVQFYLLSRQLAKDPVFEVTCIARDYGQPDGETIEGVRHCKITQGNGWLGRLRGFKSLTSGWGLYQALKRIDADIYIQRCAGVETGITAYFCKKRNKRFVYCFSSDKDADDRLEKEQPFHLAKAFRYGLPKADCIVCQNEYQKQQLQDQWNLHSVVLPSAVEMVDFRPPEGQSILWVGRAIPSKQVEVLYQLAQECPDLPFTVILSPGPDPKYHEILLAEGRRIKNVEIIPYVPFQQVEQYFAAAGVHVNTSTYEGFPNTFLQAMKHGVPVLSLSVNPNEVLTQEKAGMVAGGDIQQLKANLQTLLSDETTYRDMSRRAYDYVAHHHNVETIAGRYQEILRQFSN